MAQTQFTSHDLQPIVALCTPQGSGAIALIRLSGNGIFNLVESAAGLSSGISISNCSSHTIHHGFVLSANQEKIDEVLFLVMHGPRTFSGEDVLEITCHNNPFLIDRIIQRLCECGARRAQAGEFTRRAVLNDKLDLIQAEALHDMLQAHNEQALKAAMSQYQGTLSHSLHEIEEQILGLLTLVEASFEFLDEEQRDVDLHKIISERLLQVKQTIDSLLASFSSQTYLREGIRVALIGAVNAGKSTLFNTLLKKERALVSGIAGTTRDSIEATLQRNGLFITLVDTAGLRITNDSIEQQGIERSWKEATAADAIVLVVDSSRVMNEHEETIYRNIIDRFGQKAIIIAHKYDQVLNTIPAFLKKQDFIPVSSHSKVGVESVLEALDKKISQLFSENKSLYLLTERQYDLLRSIDAKLVEAGNELDSHSYELVACILRDGLELLMNVTGKNVQEAMFDTVFRNFCIGK